MVLRAEQPRDLAPRLRSLADIGLRHVEIAWGPHPHWVAQCLELRQAFPELCFGAASVCNLPALRMVREAGLSFAMAPVLSPELWQEACRVGLALVPGVFSPSEVHQAQNLGCPAVKLFPASRLGPGYWGQLRPPLGNLPFCIAAGGLGPADVGDWLASGVDAVALGGRLEDPGALERLRALVTQLRGSAAAAASASSASPLPYQRLH